MIMKCCQMGEEDCDLAACKSMMDILGRVKIAAERTAAEESTAVKSNTANPQGDGEHAAPGRVTYLCSNWITDSCLVGRLLALCINSRGCTWR